jgi:hypothetical protein
VKRLDVTCEKPEVGSRNVVHGGESGGKFKPLKTNNLFGTISVTNTPAEDKTIVV